jgi:hypothetical protein
VTSENLQAELDTVPFKPFRLHLVSGDRIDVPTARSAWMLAHAIIVLHPSREAEGDAGYDMIAIRNIERLEQLK